ncbi:MAG: arylsulfatase family protein [Phycisphaerales bacterium]|nr:arylsulfatase family protein [Phycisphaerales bacterium]
MMHRTAWLWAAILLLTSVRAIAVETTGKLNFLFVYTDDQRWDAMSCVQKEQGDKGRFPWLQTPNMDRLAREGVRFRNAFVINSLCAPSRSNFLTSQYSHLNGVANNHSPMPLDSVNHASILRKSGYATGYFGKFHHGQQFERPGFDVIASFIGQGKYEDCPFNVNGKIAPTKGWVDDVTTDFAIQFIKDHADRPFDMVVGFKSPHGPRTPPERAANRFEGETLRPVPNLDAVPPYKSSIAPAKPGAADCADEPPARKAPAKPAPAARKLAQLNYFRTISAADDCLGRLLMTLDDLKLAENTVVIFASDNGYYMGEHTLGDKRSAYDESMRIPLIVRYPKGVTAGRVIDQMALNIDLAPTLLGFADVAIPPSMQGRSWRPLLEGKPAPDWRSAFFYEYFFERGYAIPTVTAVRTDTAKLIKYPGHDDWTELFDLQKDPYEIKNLYGDPSAAAMRQQMESRYAAEAKAVNFKIPDYADKPPK